MSLGSRYGRGRYNPLRVAQLAPAVRRAEAGPVDLPLTATRRGCLEAIAASQVRWYPSYGWKSGGRHGVNALVRDCVRAGWAVESRDDSHVRGGRAIALTDAGRAALGDGEPA